MTKLKGRPTGPYQCLSATYGTPRCRGIIATNAESDQDYEPPPEPKERT